MNTLEIPTIIRDKLAATGGTAHIPKLKSGSFHATLVEGGVRVDNLGITPFLPWAAFQEARLPAASQWRCARKGDAMNNKLGDPGLPLDSIESHIAHVVYGKQPGDSVFRRITPIACILIWAGICADAPGGLILCPKD